MSHTARLRRSALYLPASNAKALEKARTLPADVIILDLEDAVSPENKTNARESAATAVRQGGFGRRELVVRVNGLDTAWGAEDLRVIADAGPDAILVPKVKNAADLQDYDQRLTRQETCLWAMIETCAAIPELPNIARCARNTRLSGFVIGTNDLAREMRAKPTPDRGVFIPILVGAILVARANDLSILDGVCNEFRDLTVFDAEVRQGMELGFDGKTLIHPNQIASCNEIYSPSADELAWAKAVIEAFALPGNAGKGAISVNGKLAELLHLDQAKRLEGLAAAIRQSGE